MAFHIVGVDLGGTKIATALTDTDSDILRYETVPIDPHAGPEATVAAMAASVQRVTSDVPKSSVLGVGVAIAGQVQPHTGRVVYSPNLRWTNVPFADMLAQHMKWPIYVANDTAMAALGELMYGAAHGKRHVLAVFVGTGLGAGLILDGQIYRGSAGFAGEFGQMTVRHDGPPCPSGNAGCLEGYVAGPVLIEHVRAGIAAGRDTAMVDSPELSVERIGEAYAAGDALAREVVDRAAEILGAGVANVVNLLNPEMVVLGGGVVRAVPALVERVRGVVLRRALGGATTHLIVEPAAFGRESGVIGASVFVKLAGELEKRH